MDLTAKKSFRQKLLRWYRKNRRDLPWRRTGDPYAIWVSEIMLQQTQVATVIPYYERFLRRFPTLRSLAVAREEELLALWSGLGYYRRAKLLHQGVRKVQEDFRGRLPEDPESLQEIPGIGPYTAGAIASIAFAKPAPLVDGNVIRVLSRICGLKGHAKSGALKSEVWKKAEELLDRRHPGDFNQALMELGATLCHAQLPACERCPIEGLCRARALGRPEDFPEGAPEKRTLHLNRMAALGTRGANILLVKRRESRWFQGLWGLPHDYSDGKEATAEALQAYLQEVLGIRLKNPRPLPATRHSITHHRIVTQGWIGEVAGRPRPSKDFLAIEFLKIKDLAHYPLPNFDRKVLKKAGLEAGF